MRQRGYPAMSESNARISQYMALALQPVMVGSKVRSDITRNLDHIAELAAFQRRNDFVDSDGRRAQNSPTDGAHVDSICSSSFPAVRMRTGFYRD